MIGCVNNKALERRVFNLEQENAMLRKETTDLNIKIEETNNLLYVMQDKITEQQKLIEEIKKTASAQPVRIAKRYQPSTVNLDNSPEALYRNSLDLLYAGKVDSAEKGFTEFLAKYPEHPYADNAQYWLGECQYYRKDYNSAITEFNLVLTNYPSGDKVCDATLKIGYSYIQLGDVDNGVKYLKEVIKNCGNSPVVQKAEEKIKLLGRN